MENRRAFDLEASHRGQVTSFAAVKFLERLASGSAGLEFVPLRLRRGIGLSNFREAFAVGVALHYVHRKSDT